MRHLSHLALVAALLVSGAGLARAETVVLDTYGFWRMHNTLQPPLIRDADGSLRPVLYGYEWIDCETPPPPPGWTAPDFDDSSWLRGTSHMACHTPYLSRLCMRGHFNVDDPAKVGEMRLTLAFQGGAIVYLNGSEIARASVAAAKPGEPLLAEPYPADVFVDASGRLLRGWDRKPEEQDAENIRRIALRSRELKGVNLPRELLRRGVNVLALEIVRAPYPPPVELGRPPKGSWTISSMQSLCEFNFNTCDLIGIQLTASGGMASAAVRTSGIHVWNSDVLAGDFDQDFGGEGGEPLRPVRIVGARNGVFSGKFVIGSAEAIVRPKVAVSDLVSGGARIPTSAVGIRCGRPWGQESYAWGALMGGYEKGVNASLTYRYQRSATLLGALDEVLPETVEVRPSRADRQAPEDPRIAASPAPVAGAVLPVWVTVHVPKDAAPGLYTGRATVTAAGAAPLSVPLSVTVCDWMLPDPADFRAWIDMIQSPDTLSLEYNVPLWSEQHWKLIARSFTLLRGVGNRVLYVPLIAHCNHGNAESMVRWIDRGGGKYEWDFSVMNRYLDLCLAHMGKPDIVVLYAWDIFLTESKQLKPGFDEREIGPEKVAAREAMKAEGPPVTFLDPATGKVEMRRLPLLSDPAARAPWKGLFDALRPHLDSRGLMDRVMLGTMSDAWPSKADASFFRDTAGDLRWFSDSHPGIEGLKRDMRQFVSGTASAFTRSMVYPTVKDGAAELSVLLLAGYSASVFNIVPSAENATGVGRLGWRNPFVWVQHDRHGNVHPMARWRYMPEVNILGAQRGVGRLGGDWWAIMNRRGFRSGNVRDRYPHASWRNLDMNIQMLAPGVNGAVATHRFENLREGVQECEARIAIEGALTDPALKAKLGPDLAGRAAEVLRRRANYITKACSNLQMSGVDHDKVTNTRGFYQWPNVAGHCWLAGADWMRMNEELFTMAGLVSARLAAKK